MFVGCDPDTHTTAIAIINDKGQPLGAWVCRTSAKIVGTDAVLSQIVSLCDLFFARNAMPSVWHSQVLAYAVENQEIAYTARSGKTPRGMVPVAQVAGAALLLFRGVFPEAIPWFPYPADWKGNAPKGIHQSRWYLKTWRRDCKIRPQGKSAHDASAYAVPLAPPEFIGLSDLLMGDWKHVGDAFGLAYKAKEKYDLGVRIANARGVKAE